MHTHIRELAYCGCCTALLAVCSWISIPAPVPFTLQTFAVFLAPGLLGGKMGTIAVGTYLLLGAVGLPVFAGFSGGTLDAVLAALRKKQLRIPYKAVLTAANQGWTVRQLHREIQAEHEAMNG